MINLLTIQPVHFILKLDFVAVINNQKKYKERWWTSLTDAGHPGGWTWGNNAAATLATGNSV